MLKEWTHVGFAGSVQPDALSVICLCVKRLTGLGDASITRIIAKNAAPVAGFECVRFVEGCPGDGALVKRFGITGADGNAGDGAVFVIAKCAVSGSFHAMGTVEVIVRAYLSRAGTGTASFDVPEIIVGDCGCIASDHCSTSKAIEIIKVNRRYDRDDAKRS